MSKKTQPRTKFHKKSMVELLQRTPIIQICCEKLGIARSTFYRWMENDQEFANQVEKAINDGVSLINDLAETQLISAVKDRNMSAITYWLNHRHKSYGNKLEVTTSAKREKLTEEEKSEILMALENANLIIQKGKK